MRKIFLYVAVLAFLVGEAASTAVTETIIPARQESQGGQSPATSTAAVDYSGMYTFLRDGEFVQITVEDKNKLTGFISRYGDLESDRGAFLDQFFKQGAMDGQNLSFTTETVHGVWFEFKGTAARGPGKTINDEGYYVLKGNLTQHSTDADRKDVAKSRDVVFKSFPQDVSAPASKPKE
jgi:hypothetical protein